MITCIYSECSLSYFDSIKFQTDGLNNDSDSQIRTKPAIFMLQDVSCLITRDRYKRRSSVPALSFEMNMGQSFCSKPGPNFPNVLFLRILLYA